MLGGELRDDDIGAAIICGGERGERERGGMDGDVR